MTSDLQLQHMRGRVQVLVCAAAGGAITESTLVQAGGVLENAGLSSLAYINLFEMLERSFGIVIDPEKDPQYLASVDSIVQFLLEQTGAPRDA